MVKRRYLPHTDQDRKDMLQVIGANDVMDLFNDIPEAVRQRKDLDIDYLAENELVKRSNELANKNVTASNKAFFLGGGTYDHHVPAIVSAIISRQEFLTAYVPYQPETSQGELQAMFEWQTMIAELTGMDVVNSGLYDGYNAVAEAANLAHGAVKKSSKVLVSKGVNPQSLENTQTYAWGKGYDVEEVDLNNDITSLEDLKSKLDSEVAAVIVQYPNFFGSIEDLREIRKAIDESDSKALLVVSSNPLALAKLEKPGALGADIVVGDVQPFGVPMSFGGPHVGYFGVTSKLMRKIPSRIVGQTYDEDGKRGFVMALSTREQHIRREKATSNYSSNQALFALASAVAMTAYGKEGVVEMAQHNTSKAHYAAEQFKAAGFEVLNQNEFFNEFVVKLNKPVAEVNTDILEAGYVGGYDASKQYGEENAYLVAVTEKRTKEEIDGFVKAVAEVAK